MIHNALTMPRNSTCARAVPVTVTAVYVVVLWLSAGSVAADDIALIAQRVNEDMLQEAHDAPARVPELLANLQPDGRFADIPYVPAGNDVARNLINHAKRLQTLSQAYRWSHPDNNWSGDDELKRRIRQGWDYVANQAPDNTAPNWWWRRIGLPKALGPALVLMHGAIDPAITEQIRERYFAKHRAWDAAMEHDNNAGGNLTDRAQLGLYEALLMDDPKEAVERIGEIVRLIERELIDYSGYFGMGLQPDFSMHQHPISAGPIDDKRHNPFVRVQLYSGGYGVGYAIGLARIAVWLDQTDLSFSAEAVDQIVAYVLDGQQWFMRGRLFEPTATGRGIAARGTVVFNRGTSMKQAAARLLDLGRRRDELQAYIRRIEQNGPSADNYLHGNRSFWRSDAMTHHRRGYMAAVRMISERTLRPETSSTNKKGYYLGDGFMTLVVHGAEYGAGHNEIFPVWDWERLPGVTAAYSGEVPHEPMRITQPRNNPNFEHHVGASRFVGSVSDGEYGIATLDYIREPLALRARKSWFFLDDEIVALGAGIDVDGAHPAYTSVNQVILNGPVAQAVDENPRWVYHDRVGYVFPAGNDDIVLEQKQQHGSWQDIGGNTGEAASDVFSLYLNHGHNRQGACYSYVVVPDVQIPDLQTYAARMPVQILANRPEVQAVQHRQLGIIQAVFFEPGNLETTDLKLRVDRPVPLMIRWKDRRNVHITLSMPLQAAAPGRVTVDIDLPLRGQDVVRLDQDGYRSRLLFRLPSGLASGSSVSGHFERTP